MHTAESNSATPTVLPLTEYQRKRLSKGFAIPVMHKGLWFKICPANKHKVNKIKSKIQALRLQLKKEMSRKVGDK